MAARKNKPFTEVPSEVLPFPPRARSEPPERSRDPPRRSSSGLAGPGLTGIGPELAEVRQERASTVAEAARSITELLERLPSESTRLRVMAAVSVATGCDHDALFYLDRAHGWEGMERCMRCGRTWRGARWNE